jgi:hypothetical protein
MIKRPNMPVPTFRVNQFFQSIGKPEGSTFLSDICGALRDNRPLFGQLWDDACDVGFLVEGARRQVYFFLSETLKDDDGDTQVWVFKPVMDKTVPNRLSDLKITIFNT